MNYDMTYCSRTDCKSRRCDRHQRNLAGAEPERPISMADYSKTCETWQRMNRLISKEVFVDIIKRLQDTDETIDKVNEAFRKSKNDLIRDFAHGSGLLICHDDIVLTLLDHIFDSGDLISWWVFELEYGKKYEKGCIQDKNGNDIEIPTVEKLYDYLVGEKE